MHHSQAVFLAVPHYQMPICQLIVFLEVQLGNSHFDLLACLIIQQLVFPHQPQPLVRSFVPLLRSHQLPTRHPDWNIVCESNAYTMRGLFNHCSREELAWKWSEDNCFEGEVDLNSTNAMNDDLV